MGCCNNWILILLICILFSDCGNDSRCGCGNGGLFNNNNCGC